MSIHHALDTIGTQDYFCVFGLSFVSYTESFSEKTINELTNRKNRSPLSDERFFMSKERLHL
jgi:hypothetical protein